jgi:hypothetical protein
MRIAAIDRAFLGLTAILAAAQPAPITASPVVEIRGTITQVQVVNGQGTPSLEVDVGSRKVKVYLRSMRYLIEQDFNPKAGQAVLVSGYQTQDAIVAATVTRTESNRVLKLRDKDGWPLWRGGKHSGAPTQ